MHVPVPQGSPVSGLLPVCFLMLGEDPPFPVSPALSRTIAQGGLHCAGCDPESVALQGLGERQCMVQPGWVQAPAPAFLWLPLEDAASAPGLWGACLT